MNKKWIVEIHLKELDEWVALRPTGGKRYEFATKPLAMGMVLLCYPDCILNKDVRVKEVGEEQL